jgi:hypothetical protein
MKKLYAKIVAFEKRGQEHERQEMQSLFKIGDVIEVNLLVMGKSHTTVETNKGNFNSVFFDFYLDEACTIPHDVYRNPDEFISEENKRWFDKQHRLRAEHYYDADGEAIVTYIEKIYAACSRETCYPKVAEQWSEENRFWGHCAVVAVILHDKFGGKIYKCRLKEKNESHYYNKINGDLFDPTIKQYDFFPTIKDEQQVSGDDILSDSNTMERYEKLKARINEL